MSIDNGTLGCRVCLLGISTEASPEKLESNNFSRRAFVSRGASQFIEKASLKIGYLVSSGGATQMIVGDLALCFSSAPCMVVEHDPFCDPYFKTYGSSRGCIKNPKPNQVRNRFYEGCQGLLVSFRFPCGYAFGCCRV